MMFSGQTAWFSTSVGLRKKQKWLENGGVESGFDNAEFIFSSSADSNDTERIFNSEAYQDQHLAVFHPNYIDECIKLGGPKAGVLGKYFLPPKAVQKLIRDQMSLQWDVDGHASDTDTPINSQTEAVPNVQKDKSHQQPSQPQKRPEPAPGPSKPTQDLVKPTQGLVKPTQDLVKHTQSSTKPLSSPSKEKSRRTRSPERQQQQPAVQIQLEEEFYRLEDLAKVTDELFDFTPGTSGYQIVMKES